MSVNTAPAGQSVTRRLQSELMQLMMSPAEGISAFPESESNMFRWTASITGPEGTAYEGLVFKLLIEFPSEYPFEPPVVKFKTPMWHPNIDMGGNICLDVLKERWSAVYNVQSILLSLQSLLDNPNNSSPLNAQAAALWGHDEEYKKHVLIRYQQEA